MVVIALMIMHNRMSIVTSSPRMAVFMCVCIVAIIIGSVIATTLIHVIIF